MFGAHLKLRVGLPISGFGLREGRSQGESVRRSNFRMHLPRVIIVRYRVSFYLFLDVEAVVTHLGGVHSIVDTTRPKNKNIKTHGAA